MHPPCVAEIFGRAAGSLIYLVFVQMCLCLLKWKVQTCLLNYSDFFFLCLVAMAVWKGCSSSLLHAHTKTHSTDGACFLTDGEHSDTKK